MTGAVFWRLVDRLNIPDAKALDLIGYPGKLPASGKRPRFHLTTLQTRRASFLPEIENALGAIGEDPSWLRRRIRSAPFMRGNGAIMLIFTALALLTVACVVGAMLLSAITR